jgi:hypothetical protein
LDMQVVLRMLNDSQNAASVLWIRYLQKASFISAADIVFQGSKAG